MKTDSPAPASAFERPLVSVLMRIREEARHVGRSLGSVLAQDYPSDRLEVLVADGMSEDGTREIVASLAAGRRNVRLIDNHQGIVATGLNAAIAEARGEVFVRVDGHCEIAPDYVRRCVEHLVAGWAERVGGPLETVSETRVARAITLAMSSRFGVGGSPFRTLRGHTQLVDTVAFPAYRRDVVEEAGPSTRSWCGIRTTSTTTASGSSEPASSSPRTCGPGTGAAARSPRSGGSISSTASGRCA